MIYSHKPQRSGRSISANTNNPPQDPPPPKVDDIPKIPKTLEPIVDVPIKDTTPPVMDIEEKVVVKPPVKIEYTTPVIEKVVVKPILVKAKPKTIVTPKIAKQSIWSKVYRFVRRLWRW